MTNQEGRNIFKLWRIGQSANLPPLRAYTFFDFVPRAYALG